jgi:diaminopimelate decarboxylase
MDHFNYIDGELHAEEVPLSRIATEVGTPFYCYSTATLVHHYQVFTAAFAGLDAAVFYGVKANGNLAVIRTLADQGAGADVVSEGELRLALAAGVPAARIVFSGVGKTARELGFAVEAGILQFNVESEPELEALGEIAARAGARARVAIRVNPGIDARTHDKITTGREENKFGIPWRRVPEVARRAAALEGVELVGLAVHIGSQITSLSPFEAAFRRLGDLTRTLRDQGHALSRLDLGGGLGIPYDGETPPSPAEYGAMIGRVVGDLGCTLMLEPGRLLTGNAGLLVSSVIYLKEAESRRFAVLDAAMNDLVRPSLYDARHRFLPVREAPSGAPQAPVDFVGPVCETGDTFARDVPAPPLAPGNLVAIRSAGAYGSVMASTYNGRPLVPEVLVKGADFAVVRPRPSYDELLARDVMPPWLEGRGRSRGVA